MRRPGCFDKLSGLKSTSSCRLSQSESEQRCQIPGGKLCNGKGQCNCGVCICQVTEPGKYYGPLCECHEWVCETYGGEICAGTCHCGRCKCDNLKGNGLIHGKYCECDDRECIDEETGLMCTGHGMCYCGNCYCEAGWHGDKCELQCDIAPWEIKKKCTSPNGKICSNRGTCVCGECICHDVDPTGDWGDIHGDTCECDERNCKAAYDRYSDDFCSALRAAAAQLKRARNSNSCRLNSSRKMTVLTGKCECGRCTCFPPGESKIYGKLCECDDRQCEDNDGNVCNDQGTCSCGRCICKDGWFGKLCQHPRKCNMAEDESKSYCESADGVLCSGKGSCHCGKCICSPQEWYISGEFCECDDQDCDKYDGLICTGNGICNCGNCECWEGWTGHACEIWLGTEYP
uniref:Integrin subunit beta like 1 n=2 Tax=Pseudonaja textilis TaxID=8673 RepID=A0A670YKP5_PSETE